MTDAVPPYVAAAIDLLDGYLHRVLKGREDPVEVVGELMSAMTDVVLSDLPDAGGLFCVFGDLSDITDGYPYHYGDGAEMIAQREIRDAAWDWLTTARDADGIAAYVARWTARNAALPTTEKGRPFRRDAGRDGPTGG